jgi:hypothetical protein
MRVGHVQDARIAEAFEIVEAWALGGARESRDAAGQDGGARTLKKIPPVDFHGDAARLTLYSMIRKSLPPYLMRGVQRFSEKIMLKQKG